MATFEETVTESTRFEQVDFAARGVATTAADTVALEPELLASYGLVVLEKLRLAHITLLNSTSAVSVADIARWRDQLFPAYDVAASDTVGLSGVPDPAAAVRVAERLGIAPTIQALGALGVVIEQGLQLRDTLRNFLGADAADTIGLDAALTSIARAAATATETLEVSDTLAPQLMLRVDVRDEVAIDASHALQMLYDAQVADGVEISAGFISSDGELTTWAMNARTGAVTEYTDYAFNSMAMIGGRYFGASDNGLYELLGDDDDGSPIVAQIASGYMQFGGTRLSRLKAAYLAARNEGVWILKIVTAEDREYLYSVSNRDMRSTKIHMGKGLRERYFAFELVSDGSDFDVDTLEFVPLVVKRRV